MMLIVVPPKRIDLVLRVLQRRKPVHVQAFVSEPAIERFDCGVVRGFTPTAEVQDDAVGIGSQVHRRTDELRPVIAIDPLRQAALEPQALERGRHIVAAQASTDVDRQAFAREEIDDRQRTKAPTIGQLIGDEVHAPDVVAGRRGSPLLPVHRRRVAPRTFPPEGQAFLGVHPITALFPDLPAFPAEQDPQPAVPKPDPRLGELAHALPQRRQRILP